MKIIAQVLAYNEASCLKQAIEPWLPYCESIDIFEGAFQTMINLGNPYRSDDGTLEIAKQLEKDNKNVRVFVHNEWNEPILRNNHLHTTIRDFGRKDTVLFILDADEIYSPEEVKVCIEQVKKEWDSHNTWWINFKNYISPKQYYLGFRVPRFAKLENALGFESYNGIAYEDGTRATDIKDVLPRHNSWYPIEKARRKIDWQTKSLSWTCSWVEKDGALALNELYYQETGKQKPIIYEEMP